MPVALGFHVFGLLGSGYAMFGEVTLQTRDAAFFGFFYTSLGYSIYSWGLRPTSDRQSVYLAATVLFGVLHICERYVLGYVLKGGTVAEGVYAPSYTIGTVLVTISLFLFLLSRPRLGETTMLPSWGRRYAVGIYVVHPAVLFILERIRDVLHETGYEIGNTVLWHLTFTPATFFGALLIYVAAHKLGFIERSGVNTALLARIRNRRVT